MDFIKVEMPKRKVVVVEWGKNKIKYVYFILKCYRNEKGQPTNKRVSIGRYDEETGMLIPNDNFFKYFDCDIDVKITVKGPKDEYK